MAGYSFSNNEKRIYTQRCREIDGMFGGRKILVDRREVIIYYGDNLPVKSSLDKLDDFSFEVKFDSETGFKIDTDLVGRVRALSTVIGDTIESKGFSYDQTEGVIRFGYKGNWGEERIGSLRLM